MKDVEVALGCLGYYGFGGGYAKVKDGQRRIVHLRKQDEVMYCATCPLKTECWSLHRERAELCFPSAMGEFLARAAILNGPTLVKLWMDEFGAPDPMTALMLSNIQDGQAVANGMVIPDRGERTLPWPFQKK